MTQEAMRPCPFCGEHLTFHPLRRGADYYLHPKNGCTLASDHLGDQWSLFDTPDAIAAWNLRAQGAAPTGEVAMLKRCFDFFNNTDVVITGPGADTEATEIMTGIFAMLDAAPSNAEGPKPDGGHYD